jgi:hypothetical protein
MSLAESNCISVTSVGCGSSMENHMPGACGAPEFHPRSVAAPAAFSAAWLAVSFNY